MPVEIEKIKGGYLVTVLSLIKRDKELVPTTEELFNKLLLLFEARSDTFTGDSYGKVTISREEPK